MSTLIPNLADASDFEAYIEILHNISASLKEEGQGLEASSAKQLFKNLLNKALKENKKRSLLVEQEFAALCGLKAFGGIASNILKLTQTYPSCHDDNWFRVVARFSLILFKDNEDLKKDDVTMSQLNLLSKIKKESCLSSCVSLLGSLYPEEQKKAYVKKCLDHKDSLFKVACFLLDVTKDQTTIDSVVAAYVATISNARKTISPVYLEGSVHLSQYINNVSLRDTVIPPLSRAVKRNPEIIVPAVVPLLIHTRLDWSEHLVTLAPAIFWYLKQNETPNTVFYGVTLDQYSLYFLCLKHATDSFALSELMKTLCSQMDTSKVSNDVRIRIYYGFISGFRQSEKILSKSEMKKYAEALQPLLEANLTKELNPMCKAYCLELLGLIMSHSGRFPETLKQYFEKNLKSPTTVSYFVLVAIFYACQNTTLSSKFSVFNSHLDTFLKLGQEKPGLNGKDGVLALAIKTMIALLTTGSLPADLLPYYQEGSFLYTMSIYNLTKPEEQDLIFNVASAISTTIRTLFQTVECTNAHLARLHLQLCSSSTKAVSQKSAQDIQALLKTATPAVHQLYIHTLVDYLNELSLMPVLPEEPVVPSNVLYYAVHSLFVGPVPEESIVELCYVCHFPLVSNHTFFSNHLWNKFVSTLVAQRPAELTPEEYLDQYLEKEQIVNSAFTFLTGESGLYSKNPSSRQASQRLFLSLASSPSFLDAIFPDLYDYMMDKTDPSLASSFTQTEIDIYFTPSFVVYVPPKEEEYVPQVVYSTNVKKPKYLKGNFGATDDLWAEEVKREAMKDKIAREEALKALNDKNNLLAEQDTVREKVRPIAESYLFTLEFLNALSFLESSLLYIHLNDCLHVVEQLESTFVSSLAKQCYLSFVKCIPEDLHFLSSHLVKSLHFVFDRENKSIFDRISLNTVDAKEVPAFLSDLFVETEEFLAEQVIPAPTFIFYIPLFNYITANESFHSLLSSVCTILKSYSDLSSFEEEDQGILVERRIRLLDICLSLLLINPQVEYPPEDLLVDFCSSPDLKPSEIALLISNKGLLSPSDNVRLCTLYALSIVNNPMSNPVLIIRLWLLCFDENEEIVEEATQQWSEGNCQLYPTYFAPLLVLLNCEEKKIAEMAGRALVGGFQNVPTAPAIVINKLTDSLHEYYNELSDPRIKPEETMTKRSIIYYVFTEIGRQCALAIDDVYTILDLLFDVGVCDPCSAVKKQATEAGEALVDGYSKDYATQMTDYLNQFLNAIVEDKNTPEEVLIKQDEQRKAAIIMISHSVVHLPEEDPHILSSVELLLSLLSTPSEIVQETISKCLIPLFKIPSIKEKAEQYIELLKNKLQNSKDFAERRGSARALGGILKSVGVKYLKTCNILPLIMELCQKPNSAERQTGLFMIQFLCKDLSVLMEVHMKDLIPLLLDNSSYKDLKVRDAALQASKVVMANITPYGVQRILPVVQAGLKDSRWKTKEESINMLGAMASCSPTSLSQCLPQIVPILTDCCTDTHPKIQEAAKASLLEIGRVIHTPEIAHLQEVLLKALIDPHLYTSEALDVLIRTSFNHTIDAPSLSLIIPILLRGINERSSEMKKKASLIIGNICSLASKEDVSPYLMKLIAPLQKVVLDPQPEIRAIAAHSMGMLTKEMGENEIQNLLNWLIEHIYEDSSVSERSGSAQGLAEVMAHISTQRFNEILQELEDNFKHPRACVREGVLWTISFLPNTLQDRFPPLIPRLLPAIINGLADEVDMVAQVSLKAGQVVVTVFGKSELNDILPQLLNGMMDSDWRIRQSSAHLTGDLLYALGGIKAVGMSEEENDTGLATVGVEQALNKELGEEKWHQILAYLFFLTTDSTVAVRQTAFQVWKSVVSNTPRTLKTCIEEVTTLCIRLLSGEDENKRLLASRCLGEVVQKLAEYVLPTLIPLLQKKLTSEDEHIKQGVCYGLVEIIQSCSNSNLKEYGQNFLESIKISICDEDEKVREASAIALKELQKRGDGTALENILPYLLEDLESGEEKKTSNGLNGLIQLITIQGKTVINALFPRLVETPLTKAHLEALACVTTVTTKYIHFYNKDLIHGLLTEMCGPQEEEQETPFADDSLAQSIRHACGCLCANIGEMGIQWTCTTMDKISSSPNPGWRREGCMMIDYFISNTAVDYTAQIPMLLKGIINRSVEEEKDILKACWSALTSLFNKNTDEVMLTHISFLSSHLSSVISQAKHRPGVNAATYVLPALAQPMSLKPLLKCLNKGIVYGLSGSADNRIECANLYTELINYTPEAVLKPLCVTITGPIIRIIGDRCTPEVKTALLVTLTSLLQKCQIALKAFISQLQTTFTKALRDPNENVRNQGAIALGALMELSVRVDILVKELNDDIHSAPDGVKEALLRALFNITMKVGDKISEENKHNIIENMIFCVSDKEEVIRSISATIVGVILKHLKEEDKAHVFDVLLHVNSSSSWEERHGHCLAIAACIQYSSEAMIPVLSQVITLLQSFTNENNIAIRQASMSTIEHILIQYTNKEEIEASIQKTIHEVVVSSFLKLVEDPIASVRYQAIHSIKRYAKKNPVIPSQIFNQVIPALLKSIKDVYSYVPAKLGAERALLYFFHIHDKQSTLLSDYAATIPAADGRYLKEYAKRVLSKLSPNSDDESDL